MFFWGALSAVIVLAYFFNKHKHSYWKSRGFVQLSPKFFFGDIVDIIHGKRSIGEFFEALYNKHKNHKLLGVYFSYKPALLVNDPILVQNVMIREFSKFHDRPVPFDLDREPLHAHLFHLPGQKWRDLRVKLSPTFTSGKMKGMFPVLKDCSDVLAEYIDRHVKNGDDIFEFRELMARFNTNIISSVAFGIENDCINEPDHIFRQMGVKNLKPNWRSALRNMLAFFFPFVFKIFPLKTIEPDVEEFIFSIVRQTIEHREKNNIERNDFMQLLIQLKNQGYVSVDKGDQVEGDVQKISLNDVAAQVFVFFVAGYDTSSLTLSNCLFELAKNPEIQRKVQSEIDRVSKAYGSKELTYDMLAELKYLDQCIDETLRKYPILPIIFRLCTEEYKVPDSDLTIPKDTGVFIPVLALHRDPSIYENPLEFKPERFANSPHGGGDHKGLFYMAFGDGPRNCIGMRMGKLTTKLGLVIVMSKYWIEFEDKSNMHKEMEFDPKQFLLMPKENYTFKVTPRM